MTVVLRNRLIDLLPDVPNVLTVAPPAVVLVRRANVPDGYFSAFELGVLDEGTPSGDDPDLWTPASGPMAILPDGRQWDIRFRWTQTPTDVQSGGGTLPSATLTALVLEALSPSQIAALQAPTVASHHGGQTTVLNGAVQVLHSAQEYPRFRSLVIQRVDDADNDVRVRTSILPNGGGFEFTSRATGTIGADSVTLDLSVPPIVLPLGILGTTAILAQRPLAAIGSGAVYYSIGKV